MSDSLGTIYVDLQANTGGFVSALSKAAATAQSAAKNISREFQSLGRVASQTFGAFGNFNPVISKISFALQEAGSAASSAMKELSGLPGILGPLAGLGAGAAVGMASIAAGAISIAISATESAAKLHELSQSTGVSVEALSGLGFVAKQVGVSSEEMATGLERMSRNAEMTAQTTLRGTQTYSVASIAFRQLGVEVKNADGSMRSAEAIFTDISTKFAAMPDGVNKTALAMEIFGRSGAALIPVLNQGGAAIQETLDKARAFGIVLSGDTAESAEKFRRTIGEIQAAFEGMEIELMKDLLPTLQKITEWLETKVETGQLERLASKVAELTKVVLELGNALVLVGREEVDYFSAIWYAMHLNFGAAKDSLKDMKTALVDFKDFHKALFSAPAGPKPFDMGQAMKDLGKGSSAGDPAAPVKGAAKGHDKLAAAIASVTEKAKEEIATFGVGGEAAEIYRLKVLGATEADLKQVEALLRKADAFKKINAPTAASVAAAQARGAAAGAAADAELPGLNAAMAASASMAMPDLSGMQSQPKSPVQIALEKAQEAGLRLESRSAGKFGFKGEDIESLKAMHDALASVGESTVMVDAAIQKAMISATERFDEAAMSAGTFGEKFRAMANEIELAGDNLGEHVFTALSKSIEGISGQLADFIVTGKSSFRQFFDGIAEEILKAQIQWGISKVLEHATGGPGASGSNGGKTGIGGAMAGALGIKLPGAPGAKGPLGTANDPIHVTMASAAGAAASTRSAAPSVFGSSSSAAGDGSQGAPFYSIIADSYGNPFDSSNPLPLAPSSQSVSTSLSQMPAGPGHSGSSGAPPSSPGVLSGIASIFGINSLGPNADSASSSGGAPLSSAANALSSSAINLSNAAQQLIAAAKSLQSSGGSGGGSSGGPLSFLSSGSGGGGGADSSGGGMLVFLPSLASDSSSADPSAMALGGDVSAGQPYIVGEHRPEIFVPKQSGKIVPSVGEFLRGITRREYGGNVTAGMSYLTGERRAEVFMPNSSSARASSSGAGGVTHNEFHFHGVQDADSFRRSQAQIQADMQQQMSVAHYRNRGGS